MATFIVGVFAFSSWRFRRASVRTPALGRLGVVEIDAVEGDLAVRVEALAMLAASIVTSLRRLTLDDRPASDCRPAPRPGSILLAAPGETKRGVVRVVALAIVEHLAARRLRRILIVADDLEQCSWRGYLANGVVDPITCPRPVAPSSPAVVTGRSRSRTGRSRMSI